MITAALLAISASLVVPPAPVYDGPASRKLTGCVASVELDGLILEVADSVVAPGGLGLFVRCAENVDSVTVSGGTPLCGYADGSMEMAADSAGGKTVAFALRTIGTAVFFEKSLHTVGSLLDTGVDIAGHRAVRDASGALSEILLDREYDGPRYFVPRPPDELSVMNVGQFANDLAIGGGNDMQGESYFDTSRTSNVIVLVQRLERDPTDPELLLPSRPISTLARDVTFENAVPYELGCEYGSACPRHSSPCLACCAHLLVSARHGVLG